MKIYSPNKDFTGQRASVYFIKGVGETEDIELINWFKSHGYKVEDQRVEKAATVHEEKCVEDVGDAVQPDFQLMSSDEIREWAKAQGLGGVIKNTKNKEKLIELLKG